MNLSHLLDTSVLSQPIKDKPLPIAMERWSRLGDSCVCTSAICLGELLQGLECRQSQKYWQRYRALLENRYPVLPFDAAAAQTFALLTAALRATGTPRPTVDLMIAATAKRHGLVVATLNTRDFTDIPGVAVEDWSA